MQDTHHPAPRSLLCIAAGAALAALAVAPWDRDLVRQAVPQRAGPLDSWLLWWHGPVSVAFLVLPLVAGALLLLRARSSAAASRGLFVLLLPVATAWIVRLLKEASQRLRPQSADIGWDSARWIVEATGTHSFPSGHVAGATVAAILLVRLAPTVHAAIATAVGGLGVLLMAHGRVALGAHYPSDTGAGIAVACLVAAGLLPLTTFVGHWVLRAGTAWAVLAVALGFGALGGGRLQGYDPATGATVPGVWLEPQTLRLIFEPFVGLPLEWLRAGATAELAYSAAAWAALGFLVLSVLARRSSRRQLCLGFCLALVVWGALAFVGRLPEDRFRTRSGLFLDSHVHADDPVDGASRVALQRARAHARGVDVWAWTNHDAHIPGLGALPGTEWSGGRHGEETFLHLVLLGGEGVPAALAEISVDPLRPQPLDSAHPVPSPEATWERVRVAIETAKARGAVVVVAHHWRTAAAMERAGTADHLPTPQALVRWGVDGFEVANRHPEGSPAGRARIAEIHRLCVESGLLRLAASDDHGWPRGSPVVTLLRGGEPWPREAGARRRAALEHLRQRGPTQPIVFRYGKPGPEVATVFLAPVQVLRYLASISPLGRLSWLVWALLLSWLGRRLSGSRRGSP